MRGPLGPVWGPLRGLGCGLCRADVWLMCGWCVTGAWPVHDQCGALCVARAWPRWDPCGGQFVAAVGAGVWPVWGWCGALCVARAWPRWDLCGGQVVAAVGAGVWPVCAQCVAGRAVPVVPCQRPHEQSLLPRGLTAGCILVPPACSALWADGGQGTVTVVTVSCCCPCCIGAWTFSPARSGGSRAGV